MASTKESAAKPKGASDNLKKRKASQEEELFVLSSESEEEPSGEEALPQTKRARRVMRSNNASHQVASPSLNTPNSLLYAGGAPSSSSHNPSQISNPNVSGTVGQSLPAGTALTAASTAAYTAAGAVTVAVVVHGSHAWPPNWIVNTRRRDHGVVYDPTRYRPCSKDAGLLEPVSKFNSKQNGDLYKSCRDHQ